MSALPLLLGVQPSVFISHGGGPSFFLAPDEAGPPLSILGKGSPSVRSYDYMQALSMCPYIKMCLFPNDNILGSKPS